MIIKTYNPFNILCFKKNFVGIVKTFFLQIFWATVTFSDIYSFQKLQRPKCLEVNVQNVC